MIAEPTIENLEDSAVALDAARAFILRYVAVSSMQADTLALWCAHSHAFEAAETTPYVRITSISPGSGKTRLLEVLEQLVSHPWLTGRVTGPALVRKVAAEHPTLLLDETDALFTGNSQSQQMLRGVLNSGYRLGGRTSYASGGSYVDLDTYCPKAFAGIGDLPRTVMDRSIPIVMVKRNAFAKIERLRQRSVRAESRIPRMLLARFAAQHLRELAHAFPAIPDTLDDRASDVWEPLLALADVAGGDWPSRARAAAVELMSDRTEADTESVAFALLADCRLVFDALGADRLQSAKLVDGLLALESGLWLDVDGRALDARILADLLRGFNIAPAKLRFGRMQAQGYERRAFEALWALASDEPRLDPEPVLETGTAEAAA